MHKPLSFLALLLNPLQVIGLLSLYAVGGTAGDVAKGQNLQPWRRIRDRGLTAMNVGAGLRFTIDIPRYSRSLLGLILKLGGTTFPKSYITDLSFKLGNRDISKWTGTQLDLMNAYVDPVSPDTYCLKIDFTNPDQKTPGTELVGGVDIMKMPDGRLYFEGTVSASASAPTMTVIPIWGEEQGNDIIKVVRKTGGVLGKTGENIITPEFDGMDVMRMYLIYAGTDWVGSSATAAAWSGNTGNGTCGAVTVSAAAKKGTHKIVIVEPGTNIGTFLHYDPDGILVSAKGAVASAYSGGGLAFTLADGSTDFVSGDGFDIPVGATNDGNVSQILVKKNAVTVFDRMCSEAREEQRRYNFKPQSKMFVVDFTLERNAAGVLRTVDAQSLQVSAFATATDTYDLYIEGWMNASKIR